MISVIFFALSAWPMRREPLIIVGVILTAGLLLLLLTVDYLSSGGAIELAPIFLYPVAAFVAAYAYAIYIPLRWAKKWKNHPTAGPAMECVAMFFLFAPGITLAVAAPVLWSLPQGVQVATAVLVGVVFGGVVSVPLRQFLRSLGKLPGYDRDNPYWP